MGQAEEKAKQLVASLIPSSSPCPQQGGFLENIIAGVREGGGEALRRKLGEYPIEPAEARRIAERESRALVERTVPPTPQEVLERIPRPPIPMELIPRPSDVLPTTEQLRQAMRDIIPSPRSVVEAVNFAVNPLEKARIVAQVSVPIAVLGAGALIAIAVFTK